MKIFMLLTFGFLVFAFYELSGGADFQPKRPPVAETAAVETVQTVALEEAAADAEAEAAEDEIVAETAPASQDTSAEATTADATNTQDGDDAARVALDLNSIDMAVAAANAETQSLNEQAATAEQDQGTLTASADTPSIIFPSLIAPDGDAEEQASLATLQPPLDVREVTGNRVNVRGGPSTDFGIVTRLNRGDAVEILEDNGNGWVRMRPIDGGTEGWMADFLLTSG